LLIHGGSAEETDASDDKAEPKASIIASNPYGRPSNWELDMWKLLVISIFLAFALGMFFVVYKLCAGPEAPAETARPA